MLNPICQAITDIPDLIWSFPMFLLYVVLSASFSAWIKKEYHWKTGYTRKIFHFLIFSAAVVIQWIWRLPGVLLFGCIVTCVVLLACIRGSRSSFYQAVARPGDKPHSTLFVLVPLFATALGGLIANLLFREFAVYGYLVTGWGDAVAEPVGTRWGRHRYQVASLFGIRASRSLEGTAAVLFTGMLACFIIGLLTRQDPGLIVWTMLLCGLAGAATEAVSNHGLDNLTVQITVSGLAAIILQ